MLNLKPLEVKIIDFDRVYLDTTMTIARVWGTPGYFPENAEWRNGSKKWDMYAIGAIFLECDLPKKRYKEVTIEEETIKLAEDHIKKRKVDMSLKKILRETILKP